MKFSNLFLLGTLSILAVFMAPPGRAPTNAQTAESKAEASPDVDTQQKNVQAYIELLHEDARQEKDEVMGVVMQLSAADAAKFWPIYNEYDDELANLNRQRLENIKDYARNYDQLTDEKADESIQKSVAYEKQRMEVFMKAYDKVKQALGGVTASRFALAENQLWDVIDLEMTSSLPVAKSGP